MSVQIANISLVSFAVGQGSKIDLSKVLQPATIQQQMRPTQVAGSTLILFNESGSGLTCTFPLAQETFTLAAGAWKQVMVPPAEIELDFTVTYILNATAPVSQLLADLYLPGEVIDSVGILGNSPISGATSLTTKIPVNTTGGDQTAIEIGPDPHSLSDWEFIARQNGDFALVDNKNAREVWHGRIVDGILQAPFGMLASGGSFFWQVGGIGAGFPTIIGITPSGATVNNNWALFYSGPNGALLLKDTTGNVNILQINPASAGGGVDLPSGPIAQVGGQSTAGTVGVPAMVRAPQDVAVVNSSVTSIATYTTPNDGKNHQVRVGFTFWVGAGNTNNGTVTQTIAYTDPVQGSNFLGSFVMGAAAVSAVNNFAATKGNVFVTIPLQFECSPNTTVTVEYQNSAAGTISDKVSVTIEILT